MERKIKPRAWPSSGKYWMAMGTLVAYGAGSDAVIAQGLPAGIANGRKPGDAATEQTLPLRRFDIPAGPLGGVLEEFRQASGLQFRLGSPQIREIQSPGVRGLLTSQQALEQMLRGTGLEYRFATDRSVEIRVRPQTTRVEVAGDTVALQSGKYTEPLLDTPQTINIIPREVIEQQGATTLRDVLRNVPGITLSAGEGGATPGDNVNVRGFSSRNDLFVDGVRDISPQSRDPFNLEQVEVMKGPGSAYMGRGSSGGAINLVSKQASLRRAFSGALVLGTDDTRRVTGDVNTPLPFLSERTAFRMNALYHQSGMAGRDVVNFERWGLAPTLTAGLGTPTRFTLSYFKLQQDNIADYGIPWVPASNNALPEYRDRPAPVPRDTFYGLRKRDREKSSSDSVTARVEHDFSDLVRFQNQFRYSDSDQDLIASPPRFASTDSTVIRRELRAWLTDDTVYDNQTNLKAEFETGVVRHAFVTGASLTREEGLRYLRSAPVMNTTLFHPDPDDVFPGTIVTNPVPGDVTGTTLGLYAFDTAKFGRHWEASGGLRWDRFDVNGVQTNTNPVSRVDRMTSLRAGLVYKVNDQGSFYTSYGTALNPSLEGLNYNAASQDLEPEKTYTFEAGNKWSLAQNRLLLTGAFFNVEKTNARTPGILPGDPPEVLAGRQRARGVELSATGAIRQDLQVLAAYTFLDGRIVESNRPGETGNFIQNAPRNSGSIWATYSRKRLLLGGGPRFVGKRYGNNSNTRSVDSYWTLEAMAGYEVTRWLGIRMNLYNINDAYYFDRLGGGHVVPGPSRSLQISTDFHF
ncbi:MAG: TonB-dependent siderophore receptor [Bryobacterales bacterium]|nr:TonB-dependent siderophore receptor [Bryobacterales bacterium]